MNVKGAVANGLVVILSLGVGAVLCEVGGRLVMSPADYLSVSTKPDDILGMKIAPNSGGLDDWGFRNPTVPASADIVALGDSHTFGNTAVMNDAWPSVLAHRTGRRVYNLGMGGYGPNQYYQLLTTRGMKLHPKLVLCGLYMGDDFENAFSITYGLSHWAYLRSGHWGNADPNIWGESEPPGRFKTFRNWLSRESLLYRLVVHGGLVETLKEGARFERAVSNEDPAVTAIVTDQPKIREAFRPTGIAKRLDQSSPQVLEGMRITFQLLKEMDRLCRESGCTFALVIIPTKETVFADYLQRDPKLPLRADVDKVIANERSARERLGRFLDESGILYVDTLPWLKQAVGGELYTPTTADMHPGKNGYRVIANVVADFLGRAPEHQ